MTEKDGKFDISFVKRSFFSFSSSFMLALKIEEEKNLEVFLVIALWFVLRRVRMLPLTRQTGEEIE